MIKNSCKIPTCPCTNGPSTDAVAYPDKCKQHGKQYGLHPALPLHFTLHLHTRSTPPFPSTLIPYPSPLPRPLVLTIVSLPPPSPYPPYPPPSPHLSVLPHRQVEDTIFSTCRWGRTERLSLHERAVYGQVHEAFVQGPGPARTGRRRPVRAGTGWNLAYMGSQDSNLSLHERAAYGRRCLSGQVQAAR